MLTSGKKALYSDHSRVTASVHAGAHTATERKDMKQYTQEQFNDLMRDNQWKHEHHIESCGTDIIQIEISGEYGLKDVARTSGGASITSTHDSGIVVIFNEGWCYYDKQPDSFTHDTEGLDDIYEHVGFIIVDEDGDELYSGQHYQISYPSDFDEIDYTEITDSIEDGVDADQSEESKHSDQDEFDDYRIKSDGEPDLKFKGICLGLSTSLDHNRNDRWTELYIYKTKKGAFVCYQKNRTKWVGEQTRNKAKVCKTLDEVKEFFGYGWLAKALYDDASIDYTQTID